MTRTLLLAFLRMSLRGGAAARGIGRVRAGSGRRSMLILLAFLLVMGLALGSVATRADLFTFALLAHSASLGLVGISMLSEAGDFLFRRADAEVLGPLPIPPRVLLLAKALHLLVFSGALGLVLNLPVAFFGLAADGARSWFPAAHVFSTLLFACSCAAGATFTYAVIVRIVPRKAFDSVIGWIQVLLTTAVVISYQFLPRVLGRLGSLHLAPEAARWFWFPPAWFAGWDLLLAGTAYKGDALVLAVIGGVATLALAVGAVVWLSRSFVEGAARLEERPSPRHAPAARTHEGAAGGAGGDLPGRSGAMTVGSETSADRGALPALRPIHPLLRRWLRDPVEVAAYRLTLATVARDRDMRMRVFPQAAVILVAPLLSLFAAGDAGYFRGIAIWLLGILTVGLTESLRMSDNPAAAEVFAVAPLEGSAALFHGTRKAVLSRLILPLAAAELALLILVSPNRLESVRMAIPALIALPTLSLGSGVAAEFVPLALPVTRGSQAVRTAGLWWIASVVLFGVVAAGWLAARFGAFWYLLAAEAVVLVPLHRRFCRIIAGRGVLRDE